MFVKILSNFKYHFPRGQTLKYYLKRLSVLIENLYLQFLRIEKKKNYIVYLKKEKQ